VERKPWAVTRWERGKRSRVTMKVVRIGTWRLRVGVGARRRRMSRDGIFIVVLGWND